MQNPLDISNEVSSAMNRNHPVVALESSLIAHGLPSPLNVETALAMEEIIREADVTPATIGMIDGRIKVGLTKEEIEKLSDGKAPKLTLRDIPYAVAKKTDGGFTVSATARIAMSSGILVLATGGIGGVHRGACETFDISADLWELARTPVIVVCSGAKAILDIPATVEWLETHGVPVYGYETDEFPAFYSRVTGIHIPKADGARDVAEIAKAAGAASGVRTATLIAVPVPKADEVLADIFISKAIDEAQKNAIKGKDLTPYLLKKVGELSKGKTTDCNIALLKNNARVAADIARCLFEEAQHRIGFV
ncbi:MAG: pseudouridine-5'-phosphate glycosidase [Armatimonadetes bacterium]|nr:pseudouridine-5'-phosphate glycosidase [Armatimonadota bacterium]